ncbi:hypothetical protein M8818_001842 [Zalaria obscura]|uniref:Uncharacterized protein n=1 Tax=Zalaria obscura TaxID=2024903 RepID=A0ACC3SK40_9PEZI
MSRSSYKLGEKEPRRMAMLECYQGMILQSLIGAVDNPFVYTEKSSGPEAQLTTTYIDANNVVQEIKAMHVYVNGCTADHCPPLHEPEGWRERHPRSSELSALH